MATPLLRPRDVQKLLAVDLSTVYRLAAAGTLPTVKVPGTSLVRFRAEHIETLLRRWETNGRRKDR